MKKLKPLILLSLAACALAPSCTADLFPSGGNILFRVSSGQGAPGDTRTVYGDAYGTTGTQYLSWTSGDLFRVLMFPGGSSPETGDYLVTSHAESSGVSTAEISASSASGLMWGSGTHYFYCIYPSPASEGMSGSVSVSAGTGTAAVVRCTIPEAQSLRWAADTLTGSPDMRFAYMYASASSAAGASSVPLDFHPVFTAFQFELSAAYYATRGGVTLSSFTLESDDASEPVSGEFTISGQQGSEAAGPGTSTSQRITVDLSGAALDEVGDTLVFTVFALPRTLSRLKISFTGRFGDTTEETARTLALKSASGDYLSFLPYRKYRIYGLSFTSASAVSITGIGTEGISWESGMVEVTGLASEAITWDNMGSTNIGTSGSAITWYGDTEDEI